MKEIFLVFSAIVLLIVFLVFGFSSSLPKEFNEMEMRKLKIVKQDGDGVEFPVRVADSSEERAAGFQNIPANIIGQNPMLFVFDSEVRIYFHMQNVSVPLDIAFAGPAGKISDVMRMEPGQKLYEPGRPFLYALEAAEGTFEKFGIKAGDVIVWKQ